MANSVARSIDVRASLRHWQVGTTGICVVRPFEHQRSLPGQRCNPCRACAGRRLSLLHFCPELVAVTTGSGRFRCDNLWLGARREAKCSTIELASSTDRMRSNGGGAGRALQSACARSISGRSLFDRSSTLLALQGASAYHLGMPMDMKALAQLGARARLSQLQEEISDLQRAFPDLGSRGTRTPTRRRGRRAKTAPDIGGRSRPRLRRRRRQRSIRKRKPMTAAQKKSVGERMRKYWAARRKAEKKG